MKHILIADDDANIRALVRHVLLREGYRVTEAEDGLAAERLTETETFDLAILDVMMPGLDGYTLCERLREREDLPIILLTARDQLADKERGYRHGTDDYVTKPFEPEELLFRIKALFRRYLHVSLDRIRLNQIIIDRKTAEVTDGETVFLLPLKELELLSQLAQFPGRVFSREDLIRLIWGADYEGDDRTVDVHIKRLRQRFAGYEQDFTIETVRGLGYKIEVKGR
ncbi:response regulator transcription factor [Gorillibacterium sp. CAU 1737]|uniref:response regulator transcription factor n=1 Tax=Gorillibacterium sp. CAU 1737 TaxID=3140362 RepID=UPI00326117C4